LHYNLPASDWHLRSGQTLGLGSQDNSSRVADSCTNYHEAHSIERVSVRRLKGFQVGGVAVVNCHDFARPRDFEMNPVHCAWRRLAVLVGGRYGNKREVLAIRSDGRPVGLQ